ncbi:hypothetical protein MPF19_09570 [Polaribacter sp. Z014]|uniref:hypothetical protein n=1 Tax=Polaribacter sp. Z014 TaxID=2927126 RepID=UPI00202084B3|nr:hypothetical protein [Polaribacter sp. Z014]MCL7763661.1 hypothetical protein [Polaribacter sp. Z014]
MKKIQLTTMLLILCAYVGKAQVKDISFTVSPAAEYTWWDDKAGLEDNVMVGGKLGFGFGEFIELRGIYLQSLDQKTDFSNFGITGFNPTLFDAQDVTISRYGGEFKANFGTKGIKPYFTLGAGVQNIDLDTSGDYEQVYASLGLGVKFNLSKRIVFALEAKNTTYKFNSGASLLSNGDKADFAVTDADFGSERLSNWSAQGSLQFYLGGRKPGTLSDLDKAYLQNFKGGFKGLQWVIEPSLAYVNFAGESLYKDTYMLGAYAGLDLNEYIGIRAFYFQATENEEISTNFDKMAMYGGEFRARLNDGNGVTPFLTLGGGYLSTSDNYVSAPNESGLFSNVEGGEFAMGGLGLNIPLGKNVLITAAARAIITSGEDAKDIATTDDIQTHFFYNAGIKFTLGKKSKAPSAVYQENLDRELTAQDEVNNKKIDQLKKEYQSKINALNKDLKLAYETKDVDKAVEILEEKKQVEEALNEVKEVEKVQVQTIQQPATPFTTVDTITSTNKEVITPKTATVSNPLEEKSRLIQMTPVEFESLIDRILKNIDNENPIPAKLEETKSIQLENNLTPQDQKIEELNNRIELLEKLLLQINTKQGTNNNTQDSNTPNKDERVQDMNSTILNKLDDLNKNIGSNDKKDQTNNRKTVIVSPNQNNDGKTVVSTINDKGEITNISTLKGGNLLTYKNSSLLAGFNYGGASTFNLGLRLHYAIGKTNLEFVPEAYYGIGEANAWTVSGNVIYPINLKNEKFEPYVGAGLGFGDLVDGITGYYNVVLGAKLPFIHKNLYFDYTIRNSFEYNQFAIGYTLKF